MTQTKRSAKGKSKAADTTTMPGAVPAPRSGAEPPNAVQPDLHVLVLPDGEIPADRPAIAADGGPYTLRGSTPHFAVYYENGLGAIGPTLADAVLARCEAD